MGPQRARSNDAPPGTAPITGRDQGTSTGRRHGEVMRIVRDKGFAFLLGDDDKEYFLHRSSLVGTVFDELTEGDKLSWDGMNTMKGYRATNAVPEPGGMDR